MNARQLAHVIQEQGLRERSLVVSAVIQEEDWHGSKRRGKGFQFGRWPSTLISGASVRENEGRGDSRFGFQLLGTESRSAPTSMGLRPRQHSDQGRPSSAEEKVWQASNHWGLSDSLELWLPLFFPPVCGD